jgi:hypothetical protein
LLPIGGLGSCFHLLYHLKVYFVLPRKLYGMGGGGSEQSLSGSSFASPAPWAGAGVKVFVIVDRNKRMTERVGLEHLDPDLWFGLVQRTRLLKVPTGLTVILGHSA